MSLLPNNTFLPELVLVPHLASGSWSLSSAQHLCLLNLTWLIFLPSSSCWHVVAVFILHEGLAGCWAHVLQLLGWLTHQHSKAAANFCVSRAPQPWASSQGRVWQMAGGPGGQVWHKIRLIEGAQKGQLGGEIAGKSYFQKCTQAGQQLLKSLGEKAAAISKFLFSDQAPLVFLPGRKQRG